MLFVKTFKGEIVNLQHVREVGLTQADWGNPDKNGTRVVAEIAPSGGTTTQSLHTTLFEASGPGHEDRAKGWLANLVKAMKADGTVIDPLE